MKQVEIFVGGRYLAKVSGRVVPVTVLDVYIPSFSGMHTRYIVKNEVTGREIRCSSSRFRCRAALPID